MTARTVAGIGTVGFAGLGNMGLPMARNLLGAGFAVTGCDLQESRARAFAAAGGTVAATAAEAARGADAVLTMFPGGEDVRRAYLEAGGILDSAAAGALLLDCSTIDVAAAREVAAAAAERGFAMLDAPVSGGVAGAEAGTLTFMVGGDAAAFARAGPLFAAAGKNAIHAGAAGNGQAAKICNNMLLGVSMVGTAEAFLLAEKLGLTTQAFFDVAAVSSGQCWSVSQYCPLPGPVPASPANRGYAPGFAAALMLKDLRLARQAAEECGAATPLGAHAADIYEKMNAEGGGGEDFSAVVNLIRRLRS